MKNFTAQFGKIFYPLLGFFLAVPSFALAQASYGYTVLPPGQNAQLSSGGEMTGEFQSLSSFYLQESFAVRFYAQQSEQFSEDEKLLFEKIKDENEQHLEYFRTFFQENQLQVPSDASYQPPFDPFLSASSVVDSIRSAIQMEFQEIDHLTQHINRISDQELKNFLGYLRVESYLHLCEMFVYSEIHHMNISIDEQYASSCREIMSLERIEEEQQQQNDPQGFLGSLVASLKDTSLLAQSLYQGNNIYDYGSFYEGFGYRYLYPTPFYSPYGGYGGYGRGYGGYPGYGGGGYGGYPGYGGYGGGSYGGYGQYPGIPRTPYFPGNPYGGRQGSNYFDFNFYFHNPYDQGFCYTCYPVPFGGGGRYGY